ncbi:hypothetical protein FACS189459_0900 [Bacilli bacterium]|nr:hypothetical protein FACS189459_0900 [Bacilli bacterium]
MKKIHNVKKILGTTGMAASAITSIVASTSCKDLFVVHPGIGIDISKISSNDEGLQVTVPVKNIKNVDELDLLEINNSKVVIDYVINFLTIYANNKITTNDFVISNSAYTGDKTNGSEMVVGYIGATKNSKIIFGETHFNFLVNYVQKSNDLSVLTNGNSNITINVKTDNVTNVTQQEINEINKN